jgi:hypothetical protein
MTDRVLLRRVYDAVRLALLNEWDPIGIKEFFKAADEYDAYVPDVVRLLMAHKSEKEIFNYLWQLETEHMGLEGDRTATLRFASRLMQIQRDVELAHQESSKRI